MVTVVFVGLLAASPAIRTNTFVGAFLTALIYGAMASWLWSVLTLLRDVRPINPPRGWTSWLFGVPAVTLGLATALEEGAGQSGIFAIVQGLWLAGLLAHMGCAWLAAQALQEADPVQTRRSIWRMLQASFLLFWVVPAAWIFHGRILLAASRAHGLRSSPV